MCLEWMGRLGHPTSYAMLGGSRTLSTKPASVDVRAAGGWPGSLAGGYEKVVFGLPVEYRPAVVAGLAAGIAVRIAAHGSISSSQVAFEWVAAMLSRLLNEGVPDDDAEFLAVWDAIRQPRLQSAARRSGWVEAVRQVESGKARVLCPQNGDADLQVTLLGEAEWWLRCPACGAETFVRRAPGHAL